MVGKQALTGLAAAGLLALAEMPVRAAAYDASELSFSNALASQFDLVNLDPSVAGYLSVSAGRTRDQSSYGALAVFSDLNDAAPPAAVTSPSGSTISAGPIDNDASAQTLASVFPYGGRGSTKPGNARGLPQRGIAPLPGTPGLATEGLRNSGLKPYDPVRFAQAVLPTLDTFDGKVSRDFVDAGPLATGGPSGATALAPLATIAQHSTLDGPVIIAVMSQNAELHHGDVFTGL